MRLSIKKATADSVSRWLHKYLDTTNILQYPEKEFARFDFLFADTSLVFIIIIKTSGSESRPNKVELASAHETNATTTESILHITTKLVKSPTKQPYRIYIFIS